MIRTIIKRLTAKRAKADLIARRARGSNRKPDEAAAYERVHTILARGAK